MYWRQVSIRERQHNLSEVKQVIFILFLILFNIANSQDVHFSQFNTDRINLNPSMIGNLFENDFRFSLQRRTQWSSVSIPFTSLSTTYEIKNVLPKINIGAQFLNDKVGDSKFTTNQINLAFSKNLYIYDYDMLSIGTVIGVCQRSIDFTDLVFEETEQFLRDSYAYSDFGIGVSYTTNPQNILSVNFGISSFHLNTPNNSFSENDNVRLPIKNNYFGSLKYDYLTNVKLISEVFLSKQESSSELLFGCKSQIQSENVKVMPFVYYRIKDAIIVGLGIEKNNIISNVSYDINISNLDIASNNKGGVEFSIIYLWKKKVRPSKKIDKEICPKYL